MPVGPATRRPRQPPRCCARLPALHVPPSAPPQATALASRAGGRASARRHRGGRGALWLRGACVGAARLAAPPALRQRRGGGARAGRHHIHRVVHAQGGVPRLDRSHVGPDRVRPRLHRLRPYLREVHSHSTRASHVTIAWPSYVRDVAISPSHHWPIPVNHVTRQSRDPYPSSDGRVAIASPSPCPRSRGLGAGACLPSS